MNKHQVRLLGKYTSLEYILLGDLRDLLEERADDENRKWLLAVLDALLETLPMEFDLKEEDGYLAEVLEQFPSWFTQVERLHNDHEVLFYKLKELRGRIEHDDWLGPIAGEVKRDLRDWILNLISHNRRENRLLQTAMTLEVGCGD